MTLPMVFRRLLSFLAIVILFDAWAQARPLPPAGLPLLSPWMQLASFTNGKSTANKPNSQAEIPKAVGLDTMEVPSRAYELHPPLVRELNDPGRLKKRFGGSRTVPGLDG